MTPSKRTQARSKQALSNTWLYVLRMLDKAEWAFLQRKVDFATKIANNQIIDESPSNKGVEYEEYTFEVVSCIPELKWSYVRLWLRKRSNLPQIEKVTITDSDAVLLGEWDGTKNNESFEIFLRGINRAARQYLFELIPSQPPLFHNRTQSVQLSTMLPEMVIRSLQKKSVTVQAIDFVTNKTVAELVMRYNGDWWAESILLVDRSVGILSDSIKYDHSQNLWSNEHRVIK